MKEMEDGLNEINKQVNELNAAANEKVEVNCEKACNARYNALLDKLLYAEKKGLLRNSRRRQENLCSVLKFFLESILEVDTSDIEFHRVHRVGKVNDDGRPRPIIARFVRCGDREFIFSRAKDLKNTCYGNCPAKKIPRQETLTQGKRVSVPLLVAPNRANYTKTKY